MIDLHDSHGRHIANFVSGQLNCTKLHCEFHK